MKRKPVHVSIVVFPECDPSIIYGVFDTLWAAGRSGAARRTRPSQPLFEPRLVAAEAGPLQLVTGVSIIPQDTHRRCRSTDIVFVPNVMVDTPQRLRALDRQTAGMDQADVCGRARSSMRPAADRWCWPKPACSTASRRPRTGVTRRCSADQFPNVTLHVERILVQTGRRSQRGVLRRRVVVAGPGAPPRREVWRHAGSHPDVETVPLPMASRRTTCPTRR